ncbi:hypothetical protein CC2G_007447 [Coprinopsis cinerea AmutBmut pab1-1]|nr:hypothetical protein CC2G_007447 [Coprinopsis cinerea AmutBmut pab1-1]
MRALSQPKVSLVELPVEIIDYLGSFLPVITLKSLRLTCKTMETAVRAKALANLCLYIFKSPNDFDKALKRLISLASGTYRNLSVVRKVYIWGFWTTYSTITNVTETRHKLFWKKTKLIKTVNPAPVTTQQWPSASDLDPEQPIALLARILNLLRNVKRAEFQSHGGQFMSPPAWEVLSAWISSSHSLSTIRIGSSDMLTFRNLPQLLDLAARKQLKTEWDHVGPLSAVLDYLHDVQSRGHKPDACADRPNLRLTSIRATDGSCASLRHLWRFPHLRSLHIRNFTGAETVDTSQSELDKFWEALTAERIQLEEIHAPYSTSFQTYVQSYTSTLKKVRLSPYPTSLQAEMLAWRWTKQADNTPVLSDYTIFLGHSQTLEHIAVIGGTWSFNEELGWNRRGHPLNSLSGFVRLNNLYLAIQAYRTKLDQEVPSLLQSVTEVLPGLQVLALKIHFERHMRPATESRLPPDGQLVARAIGNFRFDMKQLPWTSRTTGVVTMRNRYGTPPGVILAHRYLGTANKKWMNMLWKGKVDWQTMAYAYHVDEGNLLGDECQNIFGWV